MSADDLALDMEFAKFDLSWASVKTAYPGGYGGPVDRHRTGQRIASGLASAASLGSPAHRLALASPRLRSPLASHVWTS